MRRDMLDAPSGTRVGIGGRRPLLLQRQCDGGVERMSASLRPRGGEWHLTQYCAQTAHGLVVQVTERLCEWRTRRVPERLGGTEQPHAVFHPTVRAGDTAQCLQAARHSTGRAVQFTIEAKALPERLLGALEVSLDRLERAESNQLNGEGGFATNSRDCARLASCWARFPSSLSNSAVP
jgi:hypothetical protein